MGCEIKVFVGFVRDPIITRLDWVYFLKDPWLVKGTWSGGIAGKIAPPTSCFLSGHSSWFSWINYFSNVLLSSKPIYQGPRRKSYFILLVHVQTGFKRILLLHECLVLWDPFWCKLNFLGPSFLLFLLGLIINSFLSKFLHSSMVYITSTLL